MPWFVSVQRAPEATKSGTEVWEFIADHEIRNPDKTNQMR